MPSQSHGDGGTGDLGDKVGGNRGGVGKRYVEGLNDAWQQIDSFGLEGFLMMVSAKPIRDQKLRSQLMLESGYDRVAADGCLRRSSRARVHTGRSGIAGAPVLQPSALRPRRAAP